MYRLSYKFNNNLGTSKLKTIYHKSNVFYVAYQQKIRIVFLFNSKLNCAEGSTRTGGFRADKTDNRTVSCKHHTGKTLIKIK